MARRITKDQVFRKDRSNYNFSATLWPMEYEQYAASFFVQPAPEPRFEFTGFFGTTLFYEDYEAAVAYFTAVLGPPAYVEGSGTRGWPIGAG